MTGESNDGPKTGYRFQQGNKHGRGRPAGSRNRATVLLDAIAEGVGEEILQSVVNAARDGDLRAAELLLNRVWPIRRGRPVRIEMPEINTVTDIIGALGVITAAVADGEITPDEGAAVSAMVELKRKAIETLDMERRVTALEAARTEP